MTASGPLRVVGELELEHVPCNLCGACEHRVMYTKPDTRYWKSEHVFNAVRCRRCGLGFVNPRPSRQAITLFYPPEFFQHREIEAERRRYEAQAAFVDALPRGRVLDIGCAGGAFLKILQDRGWEVYGMDRFDAGNQYGLPILHGELADLGYPSSYFDAVTAWGVFEHLHDPKAYFCEVGRILKPRGHFTCLVTNLNSVWSRFAYCEDIPRHLYFYSSRSLSRYAALAGLRVSRVDYSGSILTSDSTDVFRVNFLRWLGIDWRDIHNPTQRRGGMITLAERVCRAAGRIAFLPRVETMLRITGTIVAVMERA